MVINLLINMFVSTHSSPWYFVLINKQWYHYWYHNISYCILPGMKDITIEYWKTGNMVIFPAVLSESRVCVENITRDFKPSLSAGHCASSSGFVMKWLCFLGVCLDRCYLVADHLHLFTTTIFPWWFVLTI